MRIYRVLDSDNTVHFVTDIEGGIATELIGDIETGWTKTSRRINISSFLSPIYPTSIFGIGLNYRAYAEQIGVPLPEYPLVFAKQPCTAIGDKDFIILPRFLPATKVDYEAELAVVIGKTCKNVNPENALDYVMGYCCANDVSSRDWQFEKGGGQFTRGKTFDTFCPLGPCLVTKDEVKNPNHLKIKSTVNDFIRQDSNTEDMIFPVEELISFLSGSTTLLPGTVILTGTPGGTGSGQNPPAFLADGDTIAIEIESIGILRNPVADEVL